MSTTDLTPRETEIVNHLPADAEEIAELCGITESRVRGAMSKIVDKVPIEKDRNGNGRVVYTRSDQEWGKAVETNPSRTIVSSSEKAAVTRKIKDTASRLEEHVNLLLQNTTPAVADVNIPLSGEDVVVIRADDHIGKAVEDEHGEVVHNSYDTVDSIDHVCQEAFYTADRVVDGGVDTLHLLLLGDTVTGEGIYPNQSYDNDLTLMDQVELAADTYYDQIVNASKRFPHVNVVCQGGNHGEIRGKNPISDGFNADSIVYRMLDAVVRKANLDNVTFLHSAATKYINFPIRCGEWTGHARHGQDSLEHIGTSSGKNKWRGWKLQHEFDIGFRGHYHELKVEEVMGSPVIMPGTLCPPDDYEESISEGGGRPRSTVIGVSDQQPLEWMKVIYGDQ